MTSKPTPEYRLQPNRFLVVEQAEAEVREELFREAVEARKAILRARKKPWWQRLWLYIKTNRKA